MAGFLVSLRAGASALAAGAACAAGRGRFFSRSGLGGFSRSLGFLSFPLGALFGLNLGPGLFFRLALCRFGDPALFFFLAALAVLDFAFLGHLKSCRAGGRFFLGQGAKHIAIAFLALAGRGAAGLFGSLRIRCLRFARGFGRPFETLGRRCGSFRFRLLSRDHDTALLLFHDDGL